MLTTMVSRVDSELPLAANFHGTNHHIDVDKDILLSLNGNESPGRALNEAPDLNNGVEPEQHTSGNNSKGKRMEGASSDHISSYADKKGGQGGPDRRSADASNDRASSDPNLISRASPRPSRQGRTNSPKPYRAQRRRNRAPGSMSPLRQPTRRASVVQLPDAPDLDALPARRVQSLDQAPVPTGRRSSQMMAPNGSSHDPPQPRRGSMGEQATVSSPHTSTRGSVTAGPHGALLHRNGSVDSAPKPGIRKVSSHGSVLSQSSGSGGEGPSRTHRNTTFRRGGRKDGKQRSNSSEHLDQPNFSAMKPNMGGLRRGVSAGNDFRKDGSQRSNSSEHLDQPNFSAMKPNMGSLRRGVSTGNDFCRDGKQRSNSSEHLDQPNFSAMKPNMGGLRRGVSAGNDFRKDGNQRSNSSEHLDQPNFSAMKPNMGSLRRGVSTGSDFIPRPGIRQESNHTSVSQQQQQGPTTRRPYTYGEGSRQGESLPTGPSMRKSTSHDSFTPTDRIPRPGMRKDSYHTHSNRGNGNHHNYAYDNNNPQPDSNNKNYAYDTLPQPGIRKESYHGSHDNPEDQWRQSNHSYRRKAPRRPTRRGSVVPPRQKDLMNLQEHQPYYHQDKQHYDDYHDNHQGYNDMHRRKQHSDPSILHTEPSSSSHRHNQNYHYPDRGHEIKTRGSGRFRRDSMLSSSGASVVSDITDCRSVGGDSLPVWGDHIAYDHDEEHDEELMRNMMLGQQPPHLERNQTWSAPTRSNHNSNYHPNPRTQRHSSPNIINPPVEAAPTTVEITPGVSLPLRGKDETLHALECRYVVEPSCMVCSLEVTCIADAEYVLCPVCKSISPIEGNTGNGGGVGLGLCNND